MFSLAMLPTTIGYQDLGSFIAQKSAVAERWRASMISSSFGTIHSANFSFRRPTGTAIPPSFALAAYDPEGGITHSLLERMIGEPHYTPLGPIFNRTLKGDRLPSAPPPEESAESGAPESDDGRPLTAEEQTSPDLPSAEAALSSLPPSPDRPADAMPAPEAQPSADSDDEASAPPLPSNEAMAASPVLESAKLYFGSEPMGPTPGVLVPWKVGEVPSIDGAPAPEAKLVVLPTPERAIDEKYAGLESRAAVVPVEPQIKLAALPSPERLVEEKPVVRQSAVTPAAPPKVKLASLPTPERAIDEKYASRSSAVAAPVSRFGSLTTPERVIDEKYASRPSVAAVSPAPQIRLASLPVNERAIDAKYADRDTGEMIAPKGQVTGPEQRPKSPAEILGLKGRDREKAQKCLAEAVYFESRGEPVSGQIGVAQVVLNRVFHYHYPKTVCDVVYQNKHRHLACQFTFACDNVPDVVTEPDAWVRATAIARDTLDGKLWVTEIGKATHYHAYWVRPSWVNEMRRLHKLGVHTFYRPRNWGNGDDQPQWGDLTATMDAVRKL